MNKKLNSVLFIAAAVIFNVLVFFIITGLFFYTIMLIATKISSTDSQQISPLLFIGAIIAGFVVSSLLYFKIVRVITKKVDMEKYFHPWIIPTENKKS